MGIWRPDSYEDAGAKRLNARQPANGHRRVLGTKCFLIVNSV